jgi:uncharacterized protein (DUF885 family)
MLRPDRAAPLVLVVVPLLAAAVTPGPAADARPPADAGAAGAPPADSALHALFEEAWTWELREDPLMATSVGRHEHDDRLPSVAPEDLRRRADRRRAFLERLRAIDRSELGTQDRISHDMFERRLELAIRSHELEEHLVPFTSETGFHTRFARLPAQAPFRSVEDYEEYLARLRAWPEHLDQQLAHLRRGLETGTTLPRAVLDGLEPTIEAHVVDDPGESVFWEPFTSFPDRVPRAERERLRREGRAAVTEAVVPGYRRFLSFFRDVYVPGARETVGASELPDGEAYYRHQIRRYTTLDRSPAEIHRLGREEVERIRAEMDAVIEATGFEGGYDEFLEFLRTDDRFYVDEPGQLLKEAAWIAKRMDGKLPSLFGELPRLPYGIEPVPDHLAPNYTAGRYVAPPLGSGQPGLYWVNTHDLESRPLYTLTALTLHEAVPGHHLQHAAQIEIEGLPAFRRHTYISAFGEGWALYAERLGAEAGLYDTPYEEFGRLTYEMWRACRLVVDTGIHAMGWSRQRARDYLASRTALSRHEVRTETDRYISWPGQALSYKMGEIEIRRLRRTAEEALGDDFDLAAFHDTILWNGTVPLPTLRERVEAWIEAERGGDGAGS